MTLFFQGVIKIRKYLILILILIMIAASVTAAAAGQNELVFDGNSVSIPVNTVKAKDVEMLSLNSIASLVGVDSQINPKAKSIAIKNSKINFQLTLESGLVTINGKKLDMGIEPAVINNEIYIPAHMVDSAFDGLVRWDSPAKRLSAFLYSSGAASGQPSGGKAAKTSLKVSKSGFIGKLVLVSKSNPVDKTYVPANLSGVLDKNKKYLLPCKTSGIKLDREALDAAVQMFKAASSAGNKDLIVSNGYRSYSLQNSYYVRKVDAYKKIYRSKQAEEKAASIVAPPGKSEHQTGLAMDVTTRKLLKTSVPLSESFGSTAEGKWLYQNSWKSGYIIRYQPDKTKITGIISEPWHIRYVGIPHAEFMHKNKLCLEEYLEYMKKTGHIRFKASTGAQYDIFYIRVPDSIDTLTLTYQSTQKYDVSSCGKNGFILTRKV